MWINITKFNLIDQTEYTCMDALKFVYKAKFQDGKFSNKAFDQIHPRWIWN